MHVQEASGDPAERRGLAGNEHRHDNGGDSDADRRCRGDGLRRQKKAPIYFANVFSSCVGLLLSGLTDTVVVENKATEPHLTPGISLRTPPGDARGATHVP